MVVVVVVVVVVVDPEREFFEAEARPEAEVRLDCERPDEEDRLELDCTPPETVTEKPALLDWLWRFEPLASAVGAKRIIAALRARAEMVR